MTHGNKMKTRKKQRKTAEEEAQFLGVVQSCMVMMNECMGGSGDVEWSDSRWYTVKERSKMSIWM